MIDYFLESRLKATVVVDGNMCRVLGEAVAELFREKARKIALHENSPDASGPYAVAILKVERDEVMRWHKDLERLIAFQRASEAEYQENLTDSNRKAVAA